MSDAQRGPGVSQATHDRAVKRRLDRIAKEAARRERIADLAMRANVSSSIAEAILLEQEAAAAAAALRSDMDAVRRVLADQPLPNEWQRRKIAEIGATYWLLRTTTKGGSVSQNTVATRVEIDRGTISAWIRKGLLTWPPEKPQV